MFPRNNRTIDQKWTSFSRCPLIFCSFVTGWICQLNSHGPWVSGVNCIGRVCLPYWCCKIFWLPPPPLNPPSPPPPPVIYVHISISPPIFLSFSFLYKYKTAWVVPQRFPDFHGSDSSDYYAGTSPREKARNEMRNRGKPSLMRYIQYRTF